MFRTSGNKLPNNIEELRKSYYVLKGNYRELLREIDEVEEDVEYIRQGGEIFVAVDTGEIISFVLLIPFFASEEVELSNIRDIISETYIFSQNSKKIDFIRPFGDVFLPPPYLYELRDVLDLYYKRILSLRMRGSMSREELNRKLRDYWKNLSDEEKQIVISVKNALKNNNENELIRNIPALLEMLKKKFPEYYLVLTQSVGNGIGIIKKLFEENLIKIPEEALPSNIINNPKFSVVIKNSYKRTLSLDEETLDIKRELEEIPYRRNRGEWPNLYDAMAIYFVCKFNELFSEKKMKMLLFSNSRAMKEIEALPKKASKSKEKLYELLRNLHVRDSNYVIALLSFLRSRKNAQDILKDIEKERKYISQFLELQGLFDFIDKTRINSNEILKNNDEILKNFQEYKQHYEDFVSLKMVQHREELLKFYADLAGEEKAPKEGIITYIIDLTNYILYGGEFEKKLDTKIQKGIDAAMESIMKLLEDLYSKITKEFKAALGEKGIKSIYIDFRRFRGIPWGIDFRDSRVTDELREFNEEIESLLTNKKKKENYKADIVPTIDRLLNLSKKNKTPEAALIIPLLLFGLRQYEESFYIAEYEERIFKKEKDYREYNFLPYSLLEMLLANKLIYKYAQKLKNKNSKQGNKDKDDFLFLIYYYKKIQDIYSKLQETEAVNDPRVINLITIAHFNAMYFGIDDSFTAEELLENLENAYRKAKETSNKPLQVTALNNILFYTIREIERNKNRVFKTTEIEKKINEIENIINKNIDKYKVMYEIFDTLVRAHYLLYKLMLPYNVDKAAHHLKEAERNCNILNDIIPEYLEISDTVRETKRKYCQEIK